MEYLTVVEAADLKGCSVQYIKKVCKDGKMSCTIEINDRKRPKYMIPVSSLPEELQARYYSQKRQEAGIPPPVEKALKQPKNRPEMAFEDFSEEERERIIMWRGIIEDWQRYRSSYPGKKTEVDKLYIAKCKLEHPNLQVSADVLYRKWAAYKDNDLAGILGKRGGKNKGASSIPEKVWNAFLWFWLDDNQPTISTCYKAVQDWTLEFYPELFDSIPTERAFRRHIDRDVSAALKVYARKGDKAMKDRFEPYIDRLYDKLHANDVWIADNHTLDIQSINGDGKTHRLYLTAFLDAKSGVLVGWNITDTPTSQSTVLALRHGIKRFGIPKVVYVDNGREFLTHDVGGIGHRKHGSEEVITPPTILQRLGVIMRNALVRNADAKPIERTFSTVTMQFSREFSGYCGGTILMKPESLKRRIKEGKLPCDFEIREALNDWIDYEFNMQEYGGKEARFKGMSRIDVWNADIKNVGVRMAAESDLNLMLMRSTRYQKIKRNGVYVTFSGEKLWYMDYEHTWEHIGEEVYVRYDPADPRTVRIYDKEDRYLWTWGVADKLMHDFMTDKVEELGDGIAITQSVGKLIKADLKAVAEGLEPAQRIDLLDMSVRRAQKNSNKFRIELPRNIIPVRSGEKTADTLEQAAGSDVVIDIARMNRNLEKKQEE